MYKLLILEALKYFEYSWQKESYTTERTPQKIATWCQNKTVGNLYQRLLRNTMPKKKKSKQCQVGEKRNLFCRKFDVATKSWAVVSKLVQEILSKFHGNDNNNEQLFNEDSLFNQYIEQKNFQVLQNVGKTSTFQSFGKLSGKMGR